MATASAQADLGRIGRSKESKGRKSRDLGRRRPVALRRREKGIRQRFKIFLREISLNHPSEHDHFRSTMVRPEREKREADRIESVSECVDAVMAASK